MMRRSHRNAVIVICVLLAAAAVWAYRNQPLWLPQASQWSAEAWRAMTRPSGPAQTTGTAASKNNASKGEPAPVRSPRKCTASDGHVTYTDEACPPGTQEQWLGEGKGAVVESVPAAKPRQR